MEQTPNYPPPPPRNYSNYKDSAPVMTVGNWITTMVIMAIPFVNIVMLIIWAASSTENPNKKNWAIVQLIFMAIAVLIGIFMAGAIASMMGNFSSAFTQ